MSRRRRDLREFTIRSTTGTAPITFTLPPYDPAGDDNQVRITLEDGSTQVYPYEALMLALMGHQPRSGLGQDQAGAGDGGPDAGPPEGVRPDHGARSG